MSGAVAALLLATASGVGALLVASNANALEAQPSRWGWTWTARPNDLDIVDRAGFEAFLRDDPRLDVVARLDQRYVVPVTANGTPIEATTGIAFLSVRGDLGPTVRSGRLPATASEVALGADTMRALHAAIGDVVSFTDSEGVAVTKLTVVGDVILPQPQYGSTRITEGAVMLPEALEELAHDEAWTDLLLGYAPEIDAAALERDLRAFGAQFDVYSRPTPPGAVTALHEARHVGELLALAFVPLALLTVVHASLVSAREHARELATLRALGLRGGQVGTALAVEAGLLGLVAAALGAPVGLLWGRWAWRVLVDSTGALTVMTVPAVFLVSAVLGVVIVTVAIGWTCGRPLGSGAPGRLLRAGFAP